MEQSANRSEHIPSEALKALQGPNPTTTRGAPSVLGVHPKEPKVIYCSGKVVVVRNLEDPTDTFVYKGHKDQTTAAKFSPNGFWVASGDITGKVRVWSYDNPEHTLKLELPVFSGEIKDLCWDPDSKRIVAVGDGRSFMARVFMWDSGNNIGEIVGHQKRILSVDYRPVRPFRIMTASEDFNVCVFEGPPFKFKQNNMNLHSNFVNCIRYSPDGELAISVGSDKLMCLYDGKSGDLLEKFPTEHASSIYAVCWSPDGKQVLTSSADKTVKLWDVESRSVTTTFTFGDGSKLSDMQVGVAWTEDYMVSLSLGGDLNYLDTANPTQPKKVVQAHQVAIQAMAAAPGRNMIFTGSYDGNVCAWDNETKVATKLTGSVHTAKLTSIAADASQVASVGWDDTARFAPDAGSYSSDCKLEAQPYDIALGPEGSDVVAIATNKGVKLLRGGSIVFETGELEWTPTCISMNSSGDLLAVGAQEGNKIHLFQVDGDSLSEAGAIEGHLGAPTTVSFSPDGTLLAVGDAYREVRVWDVASRSAKVQGLWVFHSTRVMSVAWAPSGNFVASGSLDERVYVWNVEKPMSKKCFDFAHKDGVTGVRFTSEEELVSVGNDGCVCYWDVTK